MYKIRFANIDTPELDKLLKEGYEPFAISNQGIRVWLKKEENRGRPRKVSND